MQLSFSLPSSLEYFDSLVRGDSDFALLEAAASLAQDDDPGVQLHAILEYVDQMAAAIQRRLPADASDLSRLRMLNQYFYVEQGFSGNANDFYAPENSYLPTVLKTRRGIPISLAVVWLELASSLRLKAFGVSFPSHFLVKVILPAGMVIIDPLTGRSMGSEELSEMLLPFRRSTGLQDEQETPLSYFLQSARPRDILLRMLLNLKEIFRSRQDWPRLLRVLERVIILIPDSWSDYRDRGLAHAQLGHNELALADLECYLVHSDQRADMDHIAEQADALRRLLHK